jgi:hypothetical protein
MARSADGKSMNDWIKRKRREYANRLKAEWATDVGHDRQWWLAEAKRTRTDWSSLHRQRLRVLMWIRAGRPPLNDWNKFIHRG